MIELKEFSCLGWLLRAQISMFPVVPVCWWGNNAPLDHGIILTVSM